MTTNKSPLPCDVCGKMIPAGEGGVFGKDRDGTWIARHDKCQPKDRYWQEAITRRMRTLISELERLEPEEREAIRALPEAAVLRTMLLQIWQEYDL